MTSESSWWKQELRSPAELVKLPEFETFLQESALDGKHKIDLQFLLEYIQGKHSATMASRSYLFAGGVGVGKTHFALQLIGAMAREILYVASTNIPIPRAKRCRSFKEVIELLQGNKEQIVFLDDLNCLFDRDDGDNISAKSEREFLSILDTIKAQPQKILIVTINELYDLEERMLDRIEVKIEVDLPSITHKKSFLRGQFSQYITEEMIEYLATNSLGYNYRDLPEMVRLAYRLGRGKIDLYSITEALRLYNPTQLYGFDVQRCINTTFNDVIGKKEIIRTLQRMIRLRNHQALTDKMKLSRPSLLLFHGPPGTGKTFLVRALAGQLGYPLINVRGKHLLGSRQFEKIGKIVDLAKRYHNCIVFIDEAEKMFGNNGVEDDNSLIGEFNGTLEGSDGNGVKAIFVLSVNDVSRFGNAFQDRFVTVPFNLPSYEERYAFCTEKARRSGIEIDAEYLARISEGMSFREMERTWSDLLYHYLENKNKITAGVISSIVKPMMATETIFG